MKRTLSLVVVSHLFAFVLQGAVTVNITSPTSNQVVGGTLQIHANVSSTFEITNAAAQVSGRHTNLTVSGPGAFEGAISLDGLARGRSPSKSLLWMPSATPALRKSISCSIVPL